jgi:hypothetical protein
MIIDDGKGLREQLESMIKQEKARLRGTKGITYHIPTSKLHIPKPVVNNTTDDTYTIVYQDQEIGKCTVLPTSGKGNNCGIYAICQQLKSQYPTTYASLDDSDTQIQDIRNDMVQRLEELFKWYKSSSWGIHDDKIYALLNAIRGKKIDFNQYERNGSEIQEIYDSCLQIMKNGSLNVGIIQVITMGQYSSTPLIGTTKNRVITLQDLPTDIDNIYQLQDDGNEDNNKLVFMTNNGKNHWESVIIQDKETTENLFKILKKKHEDYMFQVVAGNDNREY